MSFSSIYRKGKRIQYLLSKLLGQGGKHIVVYNKNHPIYTSIFEDTPSAKYIYVFLNLKKPLNDIEKMLLKKASIIHSDAASFSPDVLVGKPLVVECEGKPSQEILSHPAISQVFYESEAALGNLPAAERKNLKLLYPSVKVSDAVNRNKGGEEPVTLLAVGYGSMIKGFDVLYRLYETLKMRYNIRLVVAGAFGHNFNHYPEITQEAYNSADFDKIKKAFEADPNVTFAPVKRAELLANVYPKADIYLHFCRMETFGYSLIEAMSFGLPIIASRVRAIPEIVLDGKTGFLINDFADDINSKEWADKEYNEGLEAVIKLIEDPQLRQQMGVNGLAHAKSTFNLEHKRTMLEQEYDRILAS